MTNPTKNTGMQTMPEGKSEYPDDILDEAVKVRAAIGAANSIREYVTIIAKALLAERQRDRWEAIETAPKDETNFQAWVTNGNGGWWEPLARFNKDGVFETFGRVDYDQDGWESDHRFTPTHWMPHPSAPPSSTEES